MGFGKDGKGAILKEQVTLTVGALAARDLVLANSGIALDADFRILKSIVTATIVGVTSSEGNGVVLYMTQGELDEAEVEANIETNGPLSPGDRDLQEIAERWVRPIGITLGTEVSTEHVFRNETGGGILEIKPRWTFRRRRTATEGGWNWALYNDGVALTSGATLHLLATHYGVWVG